MNQEALSDNNRGRIVGALFLIPIGFLNNMVLIGPYTFAKDYLTVVAAHSPEIKLGMILGIIGGIISVSIAVLLLPIFRKHNESLAFAFLIFSVVHFTNIAIDNAAIQSLLTVSKQYANSGMADIDRFVALGAAAYDTRLWAHWMTILIPCVSLTLFFYVLFRYKLLPRFITIPGLIGVAMMALSILLMIFDKGSYLWLMAPFGLIMLVLSLWLVIKGFNTPGKGT